jgi:Ca-activated chloride channel family protein
MRFLKIMLLIAALFTGFMSFAQEPLASIAGSVKDEGTKKPLIEAVITLSSPEFEGKRFAITDSSGNYKVVNLPAGVYTVVFEMEGYSKFIKDNVLLSKGMPLGLSLEMKREIPGNKTMIAEKDLMGERKQ